MQGYAEATLSEREGRDLWLALFGDVKAQRLLAPSLSRTLPKLGLLLPLSGAALFVAWFGSPGWQFAAWVALALLIAQLAFVGHDAGHGSIARTGAANRAFGQLAMTLVTGLAFDEWIARHRAHHRHCQDEARDPDMAVACVVSLTEESARSKGALGRLLTRLQPVHIWLLSLFFGHSQRHLSQAAVLMKPGRYRLDAAMLAAHYALWFGLPCAVLGVPFTSALLAYAVPLTILGPYLAAIFWVNHIGMPLVRDAERFSFFEHQVVTSRTIVGPPAWDWVFGGLNYQIEHHLFPQVPSARLPALQSIVRAHFARHGIDYPGVPWREALRAIAAHLRRVARAA